MHRIPNWASKRAWALVANVLGWVDRCGRKHEKCLNKRLKLYLEPSQSRWGFHANVVAFCLFFLPLGLGFFLSESGAWMTAAAIVCFVLSGFALIYLLFMSTYLLRNRGYDYTEEVPKIVEGIGSLNVSIEGLRQEMREGMAAMQGSIDALVTELRQGRMQHDDQSQ